MYVNKLLRRSRLKVIGKQAGYLLIIVSDKGDILTMAMQKGLDAFI